MENFTLTAELINTKEKFEQIEEIIVIPKKYSVFIQTDKGVYKPGDEVLYRILILDLDSKPYDGECIHAIYDAKGKLNKSNGMGQIKKFTSHPSKVTKNISLPFSLVN